MISSLSTVRAQLRCFVFTETHTHKKNIDLQFLILWQIREVLVISLCFLNQQIHLYSLIRVQFHGCFGQRKSGQELVHHIWLVFKRCLWLNLFFSFPYNHQKFRFRLSLQQGCRLKRKTNLHLTRQEHTTGIVLHLELGMAMIVVQSGLSSLTHMLTRWCSLPPRHYTKNHSPFILGSIEDI